MHPRAIITSPTNRISPRRCHQSLASHNNKWRCKKNHEIVSRIDRLIQIFTQVLMMLQFFYSPSLQLNCCFHFLSAWLKPTDRLLCRCCRHPLASVQTLQQHKKIGVKKSHFADVAIFSLAIFSMTCCFSIQSL